MFVVVEWNQASHQPRIYDDEIYEVEALAEEVASEARAIASSVGRRERYTVHGLDDGNDPEN
jgi:nucleotide-binding universal stress UspA family protein